MPMMDEKNKAGAGGRMKMRLLGVLVMASPMATTAYVVPPPSSRRTRTGFAFTRKVAFYADVSTNNDLLEDLQKQKKTLYNVLGAQPTDTRAQLKQRYVALAKICHPDARRGAKKENGENGSALAEQNIPDFSEIAAAWRILSDEKQRKRYDRSLQAEEFSENVLAWVGDMAQQAAPVMESFGNVANSFLRRTTATTLAGVQAAATQVKRNSKTTSSTSSNPDTNGDTSNESTTLETTMATPDQKNAISEALKSAFDAAKIAGRKVDSLELLEKSQELEALARKEALQAATTKQELQDIVERRLSMALHTPGSGLTAAEAYVILEDFNKTIADHLTPWDRAMLRHTVEYEICDLQKEESAFVKAQVADTHAQNTYQNCVQANYQAKQQLIVAEKEEVRARNTWEDAKNQVLETKRNLGSSVRELLQAESQVKKSDWEMEVRSQALDRQAEKVRNALRNKEKQVRKERGLSPPNYMSGADQAQRLDELNRLRGEERLMAETSKRLEVMAERLFEKAYSLRGRAQELEQERQ